MGELEGGVEADEEGLGGVHPTSRFPHLSFDRFSLPDNSFFR